MLLNLHGSGRLHRRLGQALKSAIRAGTSSVYPITSCFFTPPRRAGLLFGYASLTEAEIRAGIARLADVLSARRSSAAPPTPRRNRDAM
jgi:DNA-binding transcriptional MocR family regulator